MTARKNVSRTAISTATWLALGAALVACDGGSDDRETSGSGIPAGIETLGGSSSAGGETSDSDPGAEAGGATAPDTAADEGSSGAADSGADGPKFDLGDPGGGSGGPESSCDSAADEDRDGDGFSKAQGDCNDCDANVNPGAVEVLVTDPDESGMVPEPADEDCDGSVDNVQLPCDGGLALDTADPLDAAAAIGLCAVAAEATDHGIVSAQWVRADGTPIAGGSTQHGILPDFGPNVSAREGENVLGISSGAARLPAQAGFCGGISCNGTGGGNAPAGFPQDVPSCPGSSTIYDDLALEVTLRAPTNATGFTYDFDFYSYEYPEWVCTSYNDQYIAQVTPAPEGAINGNISFDAMNNPVSVNIAFFDVCEGCALGENELAGTGFDQFNDAGATSWLSTTAPIEGGSEFTIRFALWDTGDANYDSTVILDNFRWIADGGTVDVGTNPAG